MDNRRVFSSQDFLYYSIGLGLFFLALFSIRQGHKQPSKLNLRVGGPTAASAKAQISSKGPVTLSKEAIEAQKLDPAAGLPKEKILNVMFNYNGHNFDAYEVLGLPAGARGAMVDEAYRRELGRSSALSRDFIEAAYQTLRKR
ncbi:MAG: hypothetical protein ACK5P7_12770 [Bdellovibrio sp.]